MVMPGIKMVTLIISVTEKHEFGQDSKKEIFLSQHLGHDLMC